MRNAVATFLACTLMASPALFAAEPGYYGQTALLGNTLILVCEGDLWSATIPNSANYQTIVAHRLTSGEGEETRPQVSPDGQWLAYTAHCKRTSDVYVMPIDGGVPQRIAHRAAAGARLASSKRALNWPSCN